MTEQDKQLLLVDLCARLTYGVKLLHIPSGEVTTLEIIGRDFIDGDIHDLIENFKPYLRPMSSMTEEENKKLDEIWLKHTIKEGADYLNSINVDYRGLIEKGLALEVPDGMYN